MCCAVSVPLQHFGARRPFGARPSASASGLSGARQRPVSSRAASTPAPGRGRGNGGNDFSYGYSTSDGTSVETVGQQKRIGDGVVTVMRGSYSYLAPGGQRVSVSWTADERGFRTHGHKASEKAESPDPRERGNGVSEPAAPPARPQTSSTEPASPAVYKPYAASVSGAETLCAERVAAVAEETTVSGSTSDSEVASAAEDSSAAETTSSRATVAADNAIVGDAAAGTYSRSETVGSSESSLTDHAALDDDDCETTDSMLEDERTSYVDVPPAVGYFPPVESAQTSEAAQSDAVSDLHLSDFDRSNAAADKTQHAAPVSKLPIILPEVDADVYLAFLAEHGALHLPDASIFEIASTTQIPTPDETSGFKENVFAMKIKPTLKSTHSEGVPSDTSFIATEATAAKSPLFSDSMSSGASVASFEGTNHDIHPTRSDSVFVSSRDTLAADIAAYSDQDIPFTEAAFSGGAIPFAKTFTSGEISSSAETNSRFPTPPNTGTTETAPSEQSVRFSNDASLPAIVAIREDSSSAKAANLADATAHTKTVSVNDAAFVTGHVPSVDAFTTAEIVPSGGAVFPVEPVTVAAVSSSAHVENTSVLDAVIFSESDHSSAASIPGKTFSPTSSLLPVDPTFPASVTIPSEAVSTNTSEFTSGVALETEPSLFAEIPAGEHTPSEHRTPVLDGFDENAYITLIAALAADYFTQTYVADPAYAYEGTDIATAEAVSAVTVGGVDTPPSSEALKVGNYFSNSGKTFVRKSHNTGKTALSFESVPHRKAIASAENFPAETIVASQGVALPAVTSSSISAIVTPSPALWESASTAGPTPDVKTSTSSDAPQPAGAVSSAVAPPEPETTVKVASTAEPVSPSRAITVPQNIPAAKQAPSTGLPAHFPSAGAMTDEEAFHTLVAFLAAIYFNGLPISKSTTVAELTSTAEAPYMPKEETVLGIKGASGLDAAFSSVAGRVDSSLTGKLTHTEGGSGSPSAASVVKTNLGAGLPATPGTTAMVKIATPTVGGLPAQEIPAKRSDPAFGASPVSSKPASAPLAGIGVTKEVPNGAVSVPEALPPASAADVPALINAAPSFGAAYIETPHSPGDIRPGELGMSSAAGPASSEIAAALYPTRPERLSHDSSSLETAYTIAAIHAAQAEIFPESLPTAIPHNHLSLPAVGVSVVTETAPGVKVAAATAPGDPVSTAGKVPSPGPTLSSKTAHAGKPPQASVTGTPTELTLDELTSIPSPKPDRSTFSAGSPASAAVADQYSAFWRAQAAEAPPGMDERAFLTLLAAISAAHYIDSTTSSANLIPATVTTPPVTSGTDVALSAADIAPDAAGTDVFSVGPGAASNVAEGVSVTAAAVAAPSPADAATVTAGIAPPVRWSNYPHIHFV